MSVYYSYIVKTDNETALANLLNDLSGKYPIYPVEVKTRYSIEDNRTVIGKIFDWILSRPHQTEGIQVHNQLYKSLGVNESVLIENERAVTVDHHFYVKPDRPSDTGWYQIYTTIDHSDGQGRDKVDFGNQLKAVCTRVCWSPDTDGDLYSDPYIDID